MDKPPVVCPSCRRVGTGFTCPYCQRHRCSACHPNHLEACPDRPSIVDEKFRHNPDLIAERMRSYNKALRDWSEYHRSHALSLLPRNNYMTEEFLDELSSRVQEALSMAMDYWATHVCGQCKGEGCNECQYEGYKCHNLTSSGK